MAEIDLSVTVEVQLAGVNERLSRFEHRLDRIEARCGLVDA